MKENSIWFCADILNQLLSHHHFRENHPTFPLTGFSSVTRSNNATSKAVMSKWIKNISTKRMKNQSRGIPNKAGVLRWYTRVVAALMLELLPHQGQTNVKSRSIGLVLTTMLIIFMATHHLSDWIPSDIVKGMLWDTRVPLEVIIWIKGEI